MIQRMIGALRLTRACQLRGGSGRLGSTSKGWLNGTVDLISKVVSNAAGVSSSAAHRSAMSSRLILPCIWNRVQGLCTVSVGGSVAQPC